jgi:outer membrane protein assembly factor BamB
MIKYILLFLFPLSVLAQDPSIIWSFEMNDMAFGQAAAADVDGDGLLEVTFSTYRNDGRIYMLNGEDGSELWSMDAGGCADAAPLIYDIDMDGDLEVILAGSCDPTTYCFDADSGFIQWSTPMRGSDSPPTVADVDNDGKPEILHGQFGGYVLCLNGEDGSEVWELEIDTDSWIQTAPTILDVDDDGQLDFIVATWSFFDNHMVAAYRGDDASEIWMSDTPEDYIYHGVSYGDMDNDGDVELVIGDYSGQLICLDAASGETNWTYILPSLPLYIGGPTSMGDIDNDG